MLQHLRLQLTRRKRLIAMVDELHRFGCSMPLQSESLREKAVHAQVNARIRTQGI